MGLIPIFLWLPPPGLTGSTAWTADMDVFETGSHLTSPSSKESANFWSPLRCMRRRPSRRQALHRRREWGLRGRWGEAQSPPQLCLYLAGTPWFLGNETTYASAILA